MIEKGWVLEEIEPSGFVLYHITYTGLTTLKGHPGE